MQRTVIIGDVHGCIEELDQLLLSCGHGFSDRLVFVGDLIAKGPDSEAVVRRARELGALGVKGNHDEHVLRWYRRGPAAPGALKPVHRQVAEALGPKDWAYLEALPLWLRLEEHEVIVVHGGLVPGVALEAQDPEDLLTLRSIDPHGRPSKRVDGGVPWASLWRGPETVVFGHDALRGLQRHPHAIGLDTGCVYGGQLSALVLPERRTVAVAARADHAPKEA